MKAINDYKNFVEEVSKVIGLFARYNQWPHSMLTAYDDKALLELYNRVIRYNPADTIKEAIIGDGEKDKFAGRLETVRFELDMTATFAPSYYPEFDDDLFSNEKNPQMYEALININGKHWAFTVMDRLKMIAMVANLKIDDLCKMLNDVEGFVKGKTVTPLLQPEVSKTELGNYFNAKFKGSGNNPNYYDTLIEDIKRLQTSKDRAMVALLIYENKTYFIKKQSTFAAWLRTFFELIGHDCPKEKSPNKYKPSDTIKRTFYYLA